MFLLVETISQSDEEDLELSKVLIKYPRGIVRREKKYFQVFFESGREFSRDWLSWHRNIDTMFVSKNSFSNWSFVKTNQYCWSFVMTTSYQNPSRPLARTTLPKSRMKKTTARPLPSTITNNSKGMKTRYIISLSLAYTNTERNKRREKNR